MFVPSKDGTRIPMFIVAHQNVTLDGNNPTYLYAYGGALMLMTDASPPLFCRQGHCPAGNQPVTWLPEAASILRAHMQSRSERSSRDCQLACMVTVF